MEERYDVGNDGGHIYQQQVVTETLFLFFVFSLKNVTNTPLQNTFITVFHASCLVYTTG